MDRDVNQLYFGECVEVMKGLPEASCDLLLTDPPYGMTDLSFDKAKIDWPTWWQEIHRVCKPNAVLICFAAQPFATNLINSNRRHFRYDLVWQKSSAVGFLSANVRPLRGHELILVFCRRFGRVKGVMQSCYNPQFEAGAPYHHRARPRPAAHYGKTGGDRAYDNPGRRYPTSVLRYARDIPSLHPTAKPVELLRWLVRTYSRKGERVLDPFMGSGSTCAACRIEGRKFVGIEQDARYFEVARQRMGTL